MRIGVLGPIEVIDGDARVSLSPQLRRLLGMLVVADGQPVSVGRLADHLADGRVEGSTVRTAVSRLRRAIGDRIEFADGGYRLVVKDELDLQQFEQLREQARSSPTDVRAELLQDALELWRGEAFGDLRDEEWAVVAAQAADHARLACVEELAEALIEVGDFRTAVELLESFVVDHPYREQPVGLLMRSLHGDGRTTEALRVFERFRVGLRDEVGLEPSAALRAVESALLAPDSAQPTTTQPRLPTGTVTFLFTDIVGSTQRWQADEAAMAIELAAHDRVLRDTVDEAGGQLVKHTGDGIVAVFASARSGVAAALKAQDELELPVRMGLHTGEAELRNADYYGPTLNRAARIMDAGHDGQVLLSASTAALIGDLDLTDLGEHRLKGLQSAERVWQVGDSQHPPLRAETARKGNLPSDPSPFIGRVGELDDLTTLLADHRMVSLIGVGGTGKTRLALETARSLAPAYPDGCWLVELAETTSADHVPMAIASALGLADAGVDPLGAATQLLARQRVLMLVDNCEHVLDGAADAIERILDSCPTVTVLATSREPLMVAGERLAPTPSLSPADATSLFLDRAQAEAPELTFDDVQTRAVAKICQRLDGLPLAIELAAARLRSMTPIEIEQRLDERFRLLVGGRRSRVERHRTMTAALDWSYELCSLAEQAVFSRLSVFASEFAMSDAVAVAGDADGLDETDVEDAVGQLVDRSLVQRVVRSDGASAFRLLETMRAYGHERLLDALDANHRRQRHAEHIDRTLCALSFEVWGPHEDSARARIRALAPEVLAASSWCTDAEDWPRAFRLGSACAVAAWGTTGEVMERLLVAAATNADAIKTLGRLRMSIVEDATSVIRRGMIPVPQTSPPSGADVSDWFVAEHSMIEDHLGYPAPFWRDDGDFSDALVLDNFKALVLDQFTGHEAQRCYLETMALEAHAQFARSRGVPSRVTSVEDSVRRLESRLLQKRLDSTLAFVFEQVGDLEQAADRIANAVDEHPQSPHHSDVITAVRRLRITAKAGRTVSATAFRGPWTLLEENPQLTSALPSTILNSALTLELFEQHTLARRLLLHLTLDHRGQLPPDFNSMLSPELRAVADSDEVATEPLGVVKADVFRFVDERLPAAVTKSQRPRPSISRTVHPGSV